MKANVNNFEKALRKELAADLDHIYAEIRGEFSTEQVFARVRSLLAARDANAYIDIFARSITEQEDRSRRSIPLPDTLDLFDDDVLEHHVIALGNGRRVKLGDATLQHLEAKLAAQDENAQKAAAAAEKTRRLLEPMRALMAQTHGMTVSEFLCVTGRTAAKAA